MRPRTGKRRCLRRCWRSRRARVRDGFGNEFDAAFVDLSQHVARASESGRETVRGFEDVSGSLSDDTLIGDSKDNEIQGQGQGQDDHVEGRGGDDVLSGNFVDGGSGFDTCLGVTVINCELIPISSR